MSRVNRYGHAGKNLNEKEAYRNFLSSKFNLDKTEGDFVDTKKTNESSFEEDDETENLKIKKRSAWLRIKDFLYDNWVIAIVSGVIILLIGSYISVNRELGIDGEKISNIEKNISAIEKDKENNLNNFNSLKESFNIFKAELSKDIEFIKEDILLFKSFSPNQKK